MGITERELSDQLLQRIGMGNIQNMEPISTIVELNSERRIKIPKEDYNQDIHKFIMVLGSTIYFPRRYTIDNGYVILNDDEDDIKAGRVVDFLFIYNAYTPDIHSGDQIVDGQYIKNDTVSNDKLMIETRELIESLINPDISKPADVEIEGRTLVNLLGRAGNAIYKQAFKHSCDPVYDGDAFNFVNIEQEKHIGMKFNANEGKLYLLVYDYSGDPFNGYYSPAHILHNIGHSHKDGHEKYIGKTKFTGYVTRDSTLKTDGTVICGTPYSKNAELYQPQSFKIRNLRLYEISQEIHDKINVDPEYTGDKLVEKYPYVDDIKCVVNPYIECKENLLDGDRWIDGTFLPDASLIPSEGDICLVTNKLVESDTVLSISIKGEYVGKFTLDLYVCNNDKKYANRFNISEHMTVTTTESGIICLHTRLGLILPELSIVDLRNSINMGKTRITLVKGSVPKTYDECHNSQVVFETKLYEGEKITRTNDGTYVKRGEYGEIILCDQHFIKNIDTASTYKSLRTTDNIFGFDTDITERYAVSYNGEILDRASSLESIYSWVSNTDGLLVISLPNKLTGWGPNYMPTPEEVKAYFLGWKMRIWGQVHPYDGVGKKCWDKLYCGIGTPNSENTIVLNTHTGDLPKTMNDLGYTPYRLIYKKKSACIEEVKTYGELTVKSNGYINISSGLILDESSTTNPHNTTLIGSNSDSSSKFEHRCEDILSIRSLDNRFHEFKRAIFSETTDIMVYGKSHPYNIGNDLLIKAGDNICVDYLIYRPDTIKIFNYSIRSLDNVKDILNKTIQNIANTNIKLSKENKDLNNRIDNLPRVNNANLLFNGDFQINQRGQNIYELDSRSIYTVDRWAIYRSSYLPSSLNVLVRPEGGIRLLVPDTNMSNSGIILRQIIDHKLKKDTKLTISLKTPLRTEELPFILNLSYCTNTNGTVPLTLIETPIDSDYITLTTVLPEDCESILIHIYSESVPINQEHYIDIEWVKVEIGDIATPFIPKHHGQELLNCKRYYQTLEISDTIKGIDRMYGGYIKCNIPISMRISPSLDLTSLKLIDEDGSNPINCMLPVKNISHDTFEIKTLSSTNIQLNKNNVICGIIKLDAEIY